MGVGSFFTKLAPWLSAGAQFVPGAGPVIAGVITKIAGDHGVSLPSKVEGTVSSIGDAVAAMTGNAAAMLALKQADQTYAEQMQAMGFKQITDLEALEDADRANARNREIQVKDHTPAVLAFCVTVGFFATLWYVFGHGVKPDSHDLAMVMVGVLGAAWGSVIAYYFGSSKGSEDKTQIIGDIAKQP
jgi:hypothetical protein